MSVAPERGPSARSPSPAAMRSPTGRSASRRCFRSIRAAATRSCSIRRPRPARASAQSPKISRRRLDARRRADAAGHGDGGLPDRTGGAVQPAPHVHRVLRSDGHRAPVRTTSRSSTRRAPRCTDALLPLDTDLWNGEHTRFTILFDPGRVKRGILPNRGWGGRCSPATPSRSSCAASGPMRTAKPLASEFRKDYRVGPPIERPLSTAQWRIAPPAAGSREPLRVTFPAALDHGLVQRALSVLRGDAARRRRRQRRQRRDGVALRPARRLAAPATTRVVGAAGARGSGRQPDRPRVRDADAGRRHAAQPARLPFTIR